MKQKFQFSVNLHYHYTAVIKHIKPIEYILLLVTSQIRGCPFSYYPSIYKHFQQCHSHFKYYKWRRHEVDCFGGLCKEDVGFFCFRFPCRSIENASVLNVHIILRLPYSLNTCWHLLEAEMSVYYIFRTLHCTHSEHFRF